MAPIAVAIASSIPQSLSSLISRDALSSSTTSIRSPIFELLRRQSSNQDIIPTTYTNINSGPAPGTVAGIVLGSVGGFLLCLWLFYTCATLGGISGGSDYSESVVVRSRRKSHGSRSTRSRRMSETVEVRRTASPVRIVREPERVERVIVEETRETRRERSRVGSDSDEVVVIEEHSPPRRSKSSRREKESGYRVMDPLAFGGAVGGRRH